MKKRLVRTNSANLKKLRRALLAWYDRNHRDLPWRRNPDPYRVWISEIMLQQTRVAAVLDHYARFIQRFPNVRALAAARETSVLAVWSGLGYYHRARRMHQAAKMIVGERQGRFPRNAQQWRELPGIGRYTAAAIASIAFGETVAVVDGNVERVLARVFGGSEERESAWQRAALLLDQERPGDFNQAMMELGATLCSPRTPQCPRCPLNTWCESRGGGPALRQSARKRKRLYYALVREGSAVLLVQRPADSSQMARMWELPMVQGNQRNGTVPVLRLRHSITDTDYEVAVWVLSPDELSVSGRNARWVSHKQSQRLPLTGLARKILREAGVASRGALAESNQ